MTDRKTRENSTPIFPIILAAGAAPRLGLPHASAEFGGRSALELAVRNCRSAGPGLAAPVVVVGSHGLVVRRNLPPDARVVTNHWWRRGMLTSVRAGLRRVPERAAFLLYPVDLPLLTAAFIRKLVREFHRRRNGQMIVSPIYRGRAGHPVIFAPQLRRELATARTARDVVEKTPERVRLVRVNTPAIYTDFHTPAEMRRLQKSFGRCKPR